MRWNVRRVLALVLVLGLAGSAAAAQQRRFAGPNLGKPKPFFELVDPEFFRGEYWYDGKAEVNVYHSMVMKYGQPRSTEDIFHVLVSEKHKPDLLVKADDWQQKGLVDMLKLNYVISLRTGVYRYEQMFSFFFDQSSSRLAKMTFASHEWCGNSFKELVNFGDRQSYSFNTYWDGQGSGEYDVSFPAELVVYESLPAQLRAVRWETGLVGSVELLPSQVGSRVSEPKVETARFEVLEKEIQQVPAGLFETYQVRLKHPAGVDWMSYEAEHPHRLIRWETYDGSLYELAHSKKMAYWQLNSLTDEGALTE